MNSLRVVKITKRSIVFLIIFLLSMPVVLIANGISLNKNTQISTLNASETYIVMFDTFEQQRIFLESQKDFIVLHVYTLIPAVLVRPTHNANIRQYYSIGAKFFKNRKFSPMIVKSSDGIGMATRDTANLLGASKLWSQGIKGKDVVVGVIDSGVDDSHPDLQGVVVAAKSFVLKEYGYDEDEGDTTDYNGHGTMVAGIIAGRGVEDQNRGIGIAPEAKIMSAKIFPKSGSGTDAALIAALEWCVLGEDGKPNTGDEADVINMSLGGGTSFTDPVIRAVEEAVRKYGVTIVVAAGNEGDGIWTMSISSPGAAPSVITVGAVDASTGTSPKSYTSLGPNYLLAVKPDVVGPAGVAAPSIEGGYVSDFEGTSAATPHIAGLAALLVQYLKSEKVDRIMYPGIIKSALMIAGRKSSYYLDLSIGAGLPDVSYALSLIKDAKNGSVYDLLYISPRMLPTGTSVKNLFFPYSSKLFINQYVIFNFTIVTGFNGSFIVNLEGNISDALDILSPLEGNVVVGTNYYEFEFKGKNVTEGFYEGNVTFIFSNGLVKKIPMNFTLAKPAKRALFDIKHTSWTVDFMYGQFRLFAKFLQDNNISVEHYYDRDKDLTYDKLKEYDIVFIPDAATPLYTGVLESKIIGYANFTDSEIRDIVKYVNEGGNIILVGMANDTNFQNLNKLAKCFGVEFLYQEYTRYPYYLADAVYGHYITDGIIWLPTYGKVLRVNRTLATPIATLEGKPVYALHINRMGGSAFILGTNFVFDNGALRGQYGVPDSLINKFFSNYLEMLDKLKENKISAVTYSPSGAKLGDNVQVKVDVNTTHSVEVAATDFVNEYVIGTGDPVDSFVSVSGNYKVSLAGAQGVSIRVNYGTDKEKKYIDYRVNMFSAGKIETEPPTIESATSLTITVDNAEKINITIVVKDNNKLDYVNELITVELDVFGANYTISKKSTTEAVVDITLPVDVARTALSEGEIQVKVKISAFDVNMNYSEEVFVYTIQKSQMIIIIAVVIGVATVAGLLLFLKKKKRKS